MDENKVKQNEAPQAENGSENHYTPLVNNTAANPYREQQYLPGQTIGYGLPTDQKVINYNEANVPKKDYRPLLRKALMTLIVIAAVAVLGLIALLVKKFIFS